MSDHSETWEDHENNLAAAETMAILEQQAMEAATTLETSTPGNEAMAARRRDFQVEITPNRHPSEEGEIRVSITYNQRSWSSFVLTRGERCILADALATAHTL